MAERDDPGWIDHATAAELRVRLRTLESLIARAPVPIAVAHDAECRFITANAALSALLGVPPGVNISMTPPPGQRPLYKLQRNGRDIPVSELPMQYAVAHRMSVRNEIEIVRADGEVRYVQNDVEPLYDAEGNVCGCVSVCVDLTERRLFERSLLESDRRKDEFLATLSHELRNPLAPIRHALEVMRLAADDAQLVAHARDVMERQLGQLVRLTDDLLDVSRIARNKLELRRQQVDLRIVLQHALESTRPLIDASDHTLTLDLPAEPVWLDADLARLAQAFANLLNNAAKYTPRGGRIRVCATVDAHEVAIAVADSGIGIPESMLPRIFDMFTQLDDSRDRAQGGLGIGLTLVRRLVELHGGHVKARSDGAGRGSVFTVRLPLADVAHREARERAGRPDATPPGCRILVAEDNADAAEMLRVMLTIMGADVRVATDGIEAIALAKEHNPDVALLDIGMPRMDGYSAARAIRGALGDRVVLAALTGWGQDEDKQKSFDAGFDHHFTKPVDPDVLQTLIASRAHELEGEGQKEKSKS